MNLDAFTPRPPGQRDHEEARPSVDQKIEDAVFCVMRSTPIPEIHVRDVVRKAGISRSTFYRRFDSIDAVVKQFEHALLDSMYDINSYALKGRFGPAQFDPTPSMVLRMERLYALRDKIITLNGLHGDPAFSHRAAVLMHDHLTRRLQGVRGFDNPQTQGLYLAFVIAGHNNLIQYWLTEHPGIPPSTVARVLARLFYAPFFLDDDILDSLPDQRHAIE